MGRPRIWASDAERKTAARELLKMADGRAEAIERGRLMGDETATQLHEDGHQRVQRTARAAAYAAWEFDGKPPGTWHDYQAEFGVAASAPVMPSLARPPAKAPA